MSESTIFPRDRVTIVGVLNVTPDSFSDGGRFVKQGEAPRVEQAVRTGLALVEEGAHVLDVGGESTRPGAEPVPVQEEIARTRPVLEALAKVTTTPLSIDTRKAPVAEAGVEAGARVVNDVSGGSFDPELLRVAAERRVTLVLGHMRGTPESMQRSPHYQDTFEEVARELALCVEAAEAHGVERASIVVDPGIGFGKRLEDNLVLLARCGELGRRLGAPVLVGPSRKSFLGSLTGDPVEAREVATAAACAVAIFAGADAIRVHDVASARRVAAVAGALRAARGTAA